MNEEEIDRSTENCELNNIDQSLTKRLNINLSFFDIPDENDKENSEISLTNKEYIERGEGMEENLVENRHGEGNNSLYKPLSRKDRIQLDRDTQRIIRENASEQVDAVFRYKPQPFKTFKQLQEVMANNKCGNVDKRKPAISIAEPVSINIGDEQGEQGEQETEPNEISSDIDRPLADRISSNCDQNSEVTRRALAKLSSTTRVLQKVDTVLRERYKRDGGTQLIPLKSRDQLLSEKRNIEAFMEKMRRNKLMEIPPERNTSADFIIKERQGNQLVEHRVVVKDTVKCVQLAGEIDPMLTNRAAIVQMLHESDQQKLLTMSDRDKWKKHRSLLLVAEAEKRRPAVEARLKEMELLEGNRGKSGSAGAAAAAPNADGLSDDDYEWKGDSDPDSGSGSATDPEEASDNLSSDPEDTFGKKVTRRNSNKQPAISDSEDESCLPLVPAAPALVATNNNISRDILENLSNFIDMASSEDLFAEPHSFVTTTSSSHDKSDISPADFSLVVEQPGNKDWWTVRSVDVTAPVAMDGTEQQLDDTVVMEHTRQQLGDTVAMDKTEQQLDDTVAMDRTEQQLDDTVAMEHTRQQVDDTVAMDKTEQQLDDTVAMDKTEQQLDDTVAMEHTRQQVDDTVAMDQTKQQLESSLQMRLEHRKMFEFPSIGSSSGREESMASAAISSLKELFAEQDEDDERDIDDVQLDDDDDDDNGVGLDRELSDDKSIATVVEEDESDTDEISIDTNRKSNSENENDDLEYDDDDEEELLRKRVAKAANPMEFFDNEAELSGSDAEQFGPDEDESDLDRYEEDEQEGTENLPSEGRMRRQIEKIHNRLEIDKDARDIRYLKELYLEDGDLHIAGAGQRRRRYGWAGINDDDDKFGQYEIHGNGDGDEQDIDSDGAYYEQEVLDQSNDDVDSDKDDGVIDSLTERYSRHLNRVTRVPRILESSKQQAWQINHEPVLDTAHANGTIANDEFVKPATTLKNVKRTGSMIHRVSQVSLNVNANPYQSLSLKSRMQQHTFSVQNKENSIKRQSSCTSFNEELNDNSKKPKL